MSTRLRHGHDGGNRQEKSGETHGGVAPDRKAKVQEDNQVTIVCRERVYLSTRGFGYMSYSIQQSYIDRSYRSCRV